MFTTTQKNETDDNEEYGFRNQLLVGEIEDTAYEFFHKTFPKNPQLLQQELLNKEPQLKKLLKRKVLKDHQYNLLFPPDGSFPDSTKFDITLLLILIKNFCNVNKSSADYANIICLQEARNECQHCSKKSVSEKVFNEIYNKVEQPMLDLGASRKQLDYIKNVRITDKQTKEMTQKNQQSNVAFNYNYIPPVKNFFSRDVEIQNLHQRIITSKTNGMLGVVVCGFGGNGKSEMARAYWQKYQSNFEDIVVWINCKTYESMKNAFYEIGVQCGIHNIKNIDGTFIPIKEVVYLVYDHFSKQKSGNSTRKVLFVLDNMDDQKIMQDFLPNSPTITPYILITSQDRNWDNRFDIFPLNVFSEKDSTQFLKSHYEASYTDAFINSTLTLYKTKKKWKIGLLHSSNS